MNYKFKTSHIVPAYLFVVAVLYGGSKPPSSTNEPPSDISSPTNTVGRGVLDAPQPTTNENAFVCGCGVPGGHALPLRTVATPELTANNQQLTTNVPWHVRGAFYDWVRVAFPSSFAFPHGTNLLAGVTLMADGELRENLHCPPSPSTFTLSLPHPVSLEPDASSFVHGLTPSNTYLFSCQNVCVNRSSANRVDASIELFDSGACSVRFDTVETFYPAPLPEGFVGANQDDDWLATAFPSHYAAITNGGYAAWLDDYIVCMTPNVYVVPSHIPLSQAVGARLSLYCNCSGGTWDYSTYFSNHLQLTFGFPSYAEIRTAEVADRVIVIMRAAGHECTGVFFIDSPPPNDDDPPHHQCCNACCDAAYRCDGTCCLCNCGCHSSSNSNTNAPPDSATP